MSPAPAKAHIRYEPWPSLSYWVIAREIPHVFVLGFNIWCSLAAILGTVLARKLSCTAAGKEEQDGEEQDGVVRLPAMIRPGYTPPRLTKLIWAAAGGALFVLCYCILGRLGVLGSGLFASNTTVYLVCIFGMAVAVRRLTGWRKFTADFLREVHRLEEMRILDKIISDLARRGKTRDKIKALDFGGGKGKTAAHMLRHQDVQSVASIDIKAHPPLVMQYDGHQIPFKDGEFDLAVCLYVFHHIPHAGDLITQLREKARRVLIFEDLPHVSEVPLVSRLTFGAHFLLFDQSVHTHLHHSKAEWRRLLREEWGFTVLKEFRIPPTAALPYERIALYCEAA